MARDIKYVATAMQHTWECPRCAKKFEKVTKKKWDAFTQDERVAFSELVFNVAAEHVCK